MSWANRKGFNFRSTLGFVTDGTNEQFVNEAFGAYPQSITIDGDTFNCGWETAPAGGNSRDRNAAIDQRLAGIVFVSSGSADAVFRIDLPAAGNYKIRLALGDAGNANTQKAELRDTSTVLLTVPNTATAIEEFIDASGVLQGSAATWVSSNVEVTYTFSTTILRVAVQAPSSVASTLAHLSVVADVTQLEDVLHRPALMALLAH